jgi:hypothetical protein
MTAPIDSRGPGLLTLRDGIYDRNGETSEALFCSSWAFVGADHPLIVERLGACESPAWFAVALSKPTEKDGAAVIAMIPGENVAGFIACERSPQPAWSIDLA